MATTLPFEDELLKLIFNGTAITNLAINATVTPATDFHVSLHTQNPLNSPASTQITAEVVYTAYARQVVPRTAAGWVCLNGTVTTQDVIEFPVVAGLSSAIVAYYFGIGLALSGAGKLMFTGSLVPAITLINGAQPRIDNKSIASRFASPWS